MRGSGAETTGSVRLVFSRTETKLSELSVNEILNNANPCRIVPYLAMSHLDGTPAIIATFFFVSLKV